MCVAGGPSFGGLTPPSLVLPICWVPSCGDRCAANASLRAEEPAVAAAAPASPRPTRPRSAPTVQGGKPLSRGSGVPVGSPRGTLLEPACSSACNTPVARAAEAAPAEAPPGTSEFLQVSSPLSAAVRPLKRHFGTHSSKGPSQGFPTPPPIPGSVGAAPPTLLRPLRAPAPQLLLRPAVGRPRSSGPAPSPALL